jgi:hypothetical protein
MAWLKKHGKVSVRKNVEVTRLKNRGSQGISVFGKVHGKTKASGFVSTTKTMLIATTVDSLTRLLPDKSSIYSHIHGQPFMRLYAQFAPSSRPIMATAAPSITIVPPPLQEIIPLNPQSGIYMLGYADNKSARQLHECKNDKQYIETLAEKALSLSKGSVKITHTQSHFWEIGTHYFDVLPARFQNREQFVFEAQRPYPNIFVIGEMVALNQGWVEGALQSVENVVDEINILKK